MICPRTKAKCGYLAFCDVTGMCLDDEAIRENPLAAPIPDPRLSITADEFADMERDAKRWRKFCSLDADVYLNQTGESFVSEAGSMVLAQYLDAMQDNK